MEINLNAIPTASQSINDLISAVQELIYNQYIEVCMKNFRNCVILLILNCILFMVVSLIFQIPTGIYQLPSTVFIAVYHLMSSHTNRKAYKESLEDLSIVIQCANMVDFCSQADAVKKLQRYINNRDEE